MILGLVGLVAQAAQSNSYLKDFDQLLHDLQTYGAYTISDKLDFRYLRSNYRPKFESAKTREEALEAFEMVMGELHDFHASLSTNNASSPKLVPSGTDFVAEWNAGKAVVSQVREGSAAERLGVRFGDEILSIGALSPAQATIAWLHNSDPIARNWDWGLNSAIAGHWNVPRVFKLKRGEKDVTVEVPTFRAPKVDHALTVNVRKDGIVLLRPENSLGEDELIREMDQAVPVMRKARGIILDLRNTPSGGNSNVARGIMGLFIAKRLPFQRHRVEERNSNTVRDWVEYASPRLTKPVSNKLIVLVGRWTSSMGEGIAIGFDGMHRGTVVGTKMAGLRGAVDSVELPSLGCRAFFPTEQVFHIDGTPRHEWLPPVLVKPTSPEAWISRALRILKR